MLAAKGQQPELQGGLNVTKYPYLGQSTARAYQKDVTIKAKVGRQETRSAV